MNSTKISLYIAWVVSLFSTLGSLYFSEIMDLPPCLLCWYQRIFMYPLAFILFVGIWLKDTKLPYYALPLTAVGWLIAFYHTLLQWDIIPEASAPCRLGVSCTTEYIELLGFITIPLMSLAAFSLIGGILGFVWYRQRSDESEN